MLAFYNQQYFLCADNGFFNLFFDVFRPDKLFQITVDQKSDILTFASREVLSIAACHLSRGGTPEIIGKEINNYNFESTSIKPVIDKNSIRCTVIYIDNYGNVVTNIQKKLFQNTVGDKKFKIFHGSDTDSIIKISQVYNDVSIAEKLTIKSSLSTCPKSGLKDTSNLDPEFMSQNISPPKLTFLLFSTKLLEKLRYGK